MNTYTIGPITMKLIFQDNGITDVSDWQIVMDAVEAQLRYQTDMIDGMVNGGNEKQVGWVMRADRLLDGLA